MLSLAEAKAVLRIATADTSDDTLIQDALDGLTLAFGRRFGDVIQAAITGEEHVTFPGSTLGASDTRSIQTRRFPVFSWTSVVEYSGTTATTLTRQTPGTEPADGYLAHQGARSAVHSGEITRLSSGRPAAFGRSGVVVTYVAGRFATVGAVTDDWKQAGAVALINWWRTREPGIEQQGEFLVPRSGFPTFVIPKAALELLRDEWRPVGFA